MTMLKNILPNGNIELIFLAEDDVLVSIYEIDTEEFEKMIESENVA